MPWQQYVADVVMELWPGTTNLVYPEYGLTVPRQSGKSTFVLAKATHRGSAGGFFGPRQRMVYTAQTRQKAREKFEEDYAAELAASRAFRDAKPYWGTGNEHIRYANRSKFAIEANTEKAGHGGTLDEAFIDEAFAHNDSRLEQAFRPAMITRRNKQLGWISTAGWTDASAYLQEKVKIGRAAALAGRREGLAYFEWSAPEGSDAADEDIWRGCMPALGHTITIEAIRDEFRAMKRADFLRAYLNMWVPKDAADAWRIIPYADWARCLDADFDGPLPTLAIEVAFDRSGATVAGAGDREDGKTQVGIVEHRPGIAWVVPWVRKVWAEPGPPAVLVVDPKGPAGPLIPDLVEAGVTVHEPDLAELISAYARFTDGARFEHDTVRHCGDGPLDAAVEAVDNRTIGERLTWDRKSVGVAPVIAASLALERHRARAEAGQPFFGSWR